MSSPRANIQAKNKDKSNKRKKAYFHDFSGKRGKHESQKIKPGMKGFLLTCNNNNERGALREAYNLLNEFADSIYGVKKTSNQDNDHDVTDIESQIKQELDCLKTEKRRFDQCLTKCQNILFVKCNDDSIDPIRLTTAIFESIEENKVGQQKARFLLRMIPVCETCKTDEEQLAKSMETILDKMVADKDQDYMIQCKVRNNSDWTRMSVIEQVASVVKRVRPEWKVNFDEPKHTIVAEVLQKMICLSIISHVTRFSKYNIVEFVKKIEKKTNVDPIVDNDNDNGKLNEVEKTQDLKSTKEEEKEEVVKVNE